MTMLPEEQAVSQQLPRELALAVQLARLEGEVKGALSTFTTTAQDLGRRVEDEARRNDRQDEAITRLRTERAGDVARLDQVALDVQSRAGRLAPTASVVIAALALLLTLARDLYA